jgi:hypothetical protein
MPDLTFIYCRTPSIFPNEICCRQIDRNPDGIRNQCPGTCTGCSRFLVLYQQKECPARHKKDETGEPSFSHRGDGRCAGDFGYAVCVTGSQSFSHIQG